MTNNGPVAFVSSPAPCSGTKWAGTCSNTAFFTTASDANTLLASLSAYRITIRCAQFNTLVNPCMWRTSDGSTFFQVLATGALRFCGGDVSHILSSAISAVTTGTNYTFAIEVIGSVRTLYINGSSVATDNFGAPLATFTSQTLGKFTAAEAVDGYMAGFELDDTTPTNTYTSTATPSITKTVTPTFTHTATKTATSTFSNSPTFSPTSSNTPTSTPTPACAIRFDAASSTTSYSTDFTWSHTNGASDYGALVVGFAAYGPSAQVTAVYYDGQQLTPLDDQTASPTMTDVDVSLWYLLNPPIGTYDIEVLQGSGQFCVAGAASYSGVGSIGTSGSNWSTDTTLGVTGIVTTANYSVLAGIVAQNQQCIISLGTGMLSRWDAFLGAGAAAVTGDQNDLFTDLIGTYAMNYTFGDSFGNNAAVVEELVPICFYTPTNTPTASPTFTKTITQTNTPVYSPTLTSTISPTFTVSPTFTRTVTATPTNTPRATPTPGGDLLYYCGASLTPPDFPTDIWTLAPAAGEVDNVSLITISASNMPGIQPTFYLIRRSTLDTGSDTVTQVITPRDISQGPSLSTILTWPTVPTTIGTQESIVRQSIITVSGPSAATGMIYWPFNSTGQELVVHTGEQLSIYLNGFNVSNVAVNISFIKLTE